MAAVLEVSKTALSAVPGIELVSLLVLIYTEVFSTGKTLLSIYIFCFLETLIYGFGTWTISYLYVWDVLVLMTKAIRHTEGKGMRVFINTLFGLCFGALCAVTTLFIAGPRGALSWWIAGIPWDLAHAAGNFATAFFLYQPLRKALSHFH